MALDYDALLGLTSELGYRLMESGAEIYRVEESVQRLLRAYGVTTGEVFAIPNLVIVSLTDPNGHPVTRARRTAPTSICWRPITPCVANSAGMFRPLILLKDVWLPSGQRGSSIPVLPKLRPIFWVLLLLPSFSGAPPETLCAVGCAAQPLEFALAL